MPSAPPAPPPSTVAPAPSSPPPPPPKPAAASPTPIGGAPSIALTEDARKYVALAASPLRRLHDLLPFLEAIDRRSLVPIESLEAAAKELRDIREELLAVLPPRTVKPTHDVLSRGCALALQAISARLDSAQNGNAVGDWNTASAAAGAIMLIQRGRAELGQPAK
ncbi:MAG TPA: hypothetical protein VHI99_08985 [Vicinamibacterales bacterium]|jgi:hypothetical protein|nr:hypothetical protein [Vicinamibacterales bacterium]